MIDTAAALAPMIVGLASLWAFLRLAHRTILRSEWAYAEAADPYDDDTPEDLCLQFDCPICWPQTDTREDYTI
jgi:hypothetical protein